jgi:hypothetical protein
MQLKFMKRGASKSILPADPVESNKKPIESVASKSVVDVKVHTDGRHTFIRPHDSDDDIEIDNNNNNNNNNNDDNDNVSNNQFENVARKQQLNSLARFVNKNLVFTIIFS